MFAKLIDRMMEASWKRAQARRTLKDLTSGVSLLATAPDGPPTSRTRQFTVHDALNGSYIEYLRRRYNPSGPDDYVREVYIVQPGESLVDAISAVLVILEK